jgi:iron(III)-salmochelin esterase
MGTGIPAASASVLPTVVPEVPPIPDSGVGTRGQVKTETWTLAGDGRAVTIVPAWANPDERLPMLFALHGRGEATKGPAIGVMGWPKDYALLRAIERLCAPPLTTDDFETFVEPQRLADHNEALGKRQFAGLVIVCPYSPDVDLRKPQQMREYSDYLTKTVLPRAKKELPVLGTPASIGIDGVSLGGALSLRIGLGNPDTFGAVGTLQPAIGDDQVPEYTELAKAARAKNPALHLRLLTSKEDYFKRAIKSMSQVWKSAGLDHDFEELPGPHDYPFNRGPGAIEMLLWHDRLLARA